MGCNKENCNCGDVSDMQDKAIQLILASSLRTSENNLESAVVWQKTAKFLFGGMFFFWLLSVTLAVGYFYFYDFEYEVIEEEVTETFESNQDSGDNGTNELHNVNIGGTQWQSNQ